MAERFGLSQRRVCWLLTLDRNTLRYRSRRQEDAALRMRIREIAESKRRYGCPRIYVRLRREGWRVNHKKEGVVFIYHFWTQPTQPGRILGGAASL